MNGGRERFQDIISEIDTSLPMVTPCLLCACFVLANVNGHSISNASLFMVSHFLKLAQIPFLSRLAHNPYPIDPHFIPISFTVHNEHHQ